ncbi:hypothetical protein [Kallotenue papyrolyticum]|nr:hypothetical protein [Kallotenue papyrolyticum]
MEAVLVAVLKWLLLLVMAGGAVAVLRELIALARGRSFAPAERREEQS